MIRSLIAFTCILIGWVYFGSSRIERSQAPVAPQAGLQKITILAGRWKVEGKIFDTDFS